MPVSGSFDRRRSRRRLGLGAAAATGADVKGDTGGATCGSTALHVLLWLLLLTAVAALAYVIYMVVVSSRKLSEERRKKMTKMMSRRTTTTPTPTPMPTTRQQRLRGSGSGGAWSALMYEGYEDVLASQAGDEYSSNGGSSKGGSMPAPVGDPSTSATPPPPPAMSPLVEPVAEAPTMAVVYLYMHGCGYCKRFDPTWNEFVGTRGAQLREMGIALQSFDSASPEARAYGAKMFPTILFAVHGEKRATFEGARTLDALLKFAIDQGVRFGGAYGRGP